MFTAYKPLRNQLRQLEALPALETVWAFVQNLQFDRTLPRAFNHPMRAYRTGSSLGLFEWEFETLARDILANSSPQRGKGIPDWQATSKLINEVRRVEAAAYRGRIGPDDVMYELYRVSHRQWPWQAKVTHDEIMRHYKLYNHPRMQPLIQDVFGMGVTEIYQIGIALTGSFQQSMYVQLPIANRINNVAADTINRFLDHFSADLTTLSAAARARASFDVNWAYSFDPLRLHPLIKTSDGRLAAPLTPLFLRRLLDGLYFDIVPLPMFGNAMGASFQDYIGDVVNAANRDGRMTLLSERRYGPAGAARDSVDWIVDDESGTLFIECKVARMKIAGKVDLTSREALTEELERLAMNVVQMYAALRDALDGRYPHWQRDTKPVYPMLVTLDEWHAFGQHIATILDPLVAAGFEQRGLDPTLLTDHPYQICSAETFETVSQIMAMGSIAGFMDAKLDNEHRLWPMHSFVATHMQEQFALCRSLFPEVWRTLEATARRN